jgi:hypothetical protein
MRVKRWSLQCMGEHSVSQQSHAEREMANVRGFSHNSAFVRNVPMFGAVYRGQQQCDGTGTAPASVSVPAPGLGWAGLVNKQRWCGQ